MHSYMIRNEIEINIFVDTSLTDLYSKCASIEMARLLFDKMS